MVSTASIKISEDLRKRIYWLKGPAKTYDEFIKELLDEKEGITLETV